MKKVIISLAVIALLALACGEKESVTPGPPDRIEPTSPVYALANVRLSFNLRKIDLLKAMLSEDFVFYFDPRDVGANPPGSSYTIPESWSYTEFWCALRNMFRQAYSINLKITTNGVGAPGENETTYRADNVTISLLVMVTELNGFIADGGYCNFEFERYDAASGKKYWRLIAWWDRTSENLDAYPGVAPSTFGRVLALYY
jgi:hypothetical protein